MTLATGAEGKSTLAMNLTIAMSNIGKILLLEVDLRKPSISNNLTFGKTLGLSNNLSGEVKVLSDVVKHRIMANKNYTSGSIPQDPMELMSSTKFQLLLVSLSERYEHIILDGLPTLPVSDTCVLANKADAVIVTVRAEQTRITVAKKSVSRLQKLNADIIGAERTAVELKKMSYYGDHYYAGEYYGVKLEDAKA